MVLKEEEMLQCYRQNENWQWKRGKQNTAHIEAAKLMHSKNSG